VGPKRRLGGSAGQGGKGGGKTWLDFQMTHDRWGLYHKGGGNDNLGIKFFIRQENTKTRKIQKLRNCSRK